MLPASEILIRPPIEANSLLIPVTGGCSWNHCRFCGIYKGVQDYAIRPLEEVLRDIELYAHDYPKVPTIYLAGGNPTSAPTEYLVKILKTIKTKFPNAQRISSYAKVLDIIRKNDEELQQLAQAGLTIVYMGMESGSDTVLKYMRKGTTAASLISAVKRLMQAGVQVSLYLIMGLGGKKWTEEHARETARVLNAINPTFFRFRTLNILDSSPLKADVEKGDFELLTPFEILKEFRAIISQLDTQLTAKMRNDHISNYVSIESDNIGKDRDAIVKYLDDLLKDPTTAKWQPKNLKTM
jgi:radical SAM superfamily enzyme YgiQ (UPF0313 family)